MTTNNNSPQSPLEYPANGTIPVRIFRRNRAPLSSDYRNFKVRDFWNDTALDNLWYLTSKSTTSGTWIMLGGGTAGDIQFLDGDSGGNIPPDVSGVVGVLGGTNITSVGSVNDVTFNLDDNIEVTSVSFDSGSNLMSAYEEGTWTPTLSFGGGSAGITYSSQVGTYTRIGNTVFYTIFLLLTSKGSSTGNALVSGFPFTAGSSNYTSAIGGTSFLSLSPSYNTFGMRVVTATTTADILQSGDNTVFAFITDAQYNNNSLITTTGFYIV